MSSELLASRRGGRLWAALREGGRTVELRVEPDPADPCAERVVRARITSEAPGLGAVFADVGGKRPAWVDARHLAGERRAGAELLLQVEHEGRQAKGPRASPRIALPGRRLVLLPGVARRTVSRRIADPAERERLRGLLARLPLAMGGWIARAAAEGVEESVIGADGARLEARWAEALERSAGRAAPATVLGEPGLLEELLREAPPRGFDRIVVDDEQDRQGALAYLRVHDPALLPRLFLHSTGPPLFESAGVDLEIERALARRVSLPSGGEIVIEETEALVSIDVDTAGSPAAGVAAEPTFVSTNLEAAREIARQLRLRGLGGIVVVDFIGMRGQAGRDAVLDALREGLRSDPARTKVAATEGIGLVALTRETHRAGLAARLTRVCETCRGTGLVRLPRPR